MTDPRVASAGFAVAGAFLLALFTAAVADAPAKKDDKSGVRELDLKGLKSDSPREGKVDSPTKITTEEELTKAFPDEELQARLKKEVDFKKEQLLFFAWAGSGGDKVDFKVEKGEKGPEVVFVYQPGRTKDLRSHVHLYAIPKEATWRMGK